jgi:hypothetical protein
MSQDDYDRSVATAYELVHNEGSEAILPSKLTQGLLGAPVTARRWLSLASPYKDGEEDYFSSDLGDAQLKRRFGALPARTPICILYSEADEWVPGFVDKKALIRKWIGYIKESGGKVDEVHSGIIEGASHNLKRSKPEAVEEMLRRVLGFLSSLRTPASL